MANDQRDIMVDEQGRLLIRNGDLVTGESYTQEVGLLLLTNQGELRHDPLAGCDLVRRLNSRTTRTGLEQVLRVQIERDGKRWSDVRNGVKLSTNG